MYVCTYVCACIIQFRSIRLTVSVTYENQKEWPVQHWQNVSVSLGHLGLNTFLNTKNAQLAVRLQLLLCSAHIGELCASQIISFIILTLFNMKHAKTMCTWRRACSALVCGLGVFCRCVCPDCNTLVNPHTSKSDQASSYQGYSYTQSVRSVHLTVKYFQKQIYNYLRNC
jgi:hypothetical protein